MNRNPFRRPPDLPPGYRERIWERVEAVLEEERRRRRAPVHVFPTRRQRILAAAAAALALLGAGWWLLGLGGAPDRLPGTPGPAGDLQVADAGGPGAPRIPGPGSPGPEAGEGSRQPLHPAGSAGPVELAVALASPRGTPLECEVLALQPVDAEGRPLGPPLGARTLRPWRRPGPPGVLRFRLPAGTLPRGAVAMVVHPGGPGSPAAGRLPLPGDGGGEEVPPPLASTATYSYGAVVVDAATGLPLEGVAVRYVPEDPAFDPARSTTGTGNPCPLEFTGADGAFAGLTDLAGPHSLVLALPGYVPVQIDGVHPDTATGLPATIALERGRSLQGRVVDETGTPVPDLLLALAGGHPRNVTQLGRALGWRALQVVRTAADGTFQAAGLAPAGVGATLLTVDLLGQARAPEPAPGTSTWLDPLEVPQVADPALDEVALASTLEDAVAAGPGRVAVPLEDALAGVLDLSLELHVLELLVQDYDLTPSLDAAVTVRPQDARLEPLEAPVDAVRGTARFLVPADRELRLEAANGAGQASGLTVIPALGSAREARVTLTLFPQDRAGVDFILRDSLGGLVAGARSAPLLDGLPTEAARPVPVRPGSPDGHYRLLLPPGHHVLALFGPPASAGAIGPFGFTTLEVDLADGQYLDLGERTLPRGLAVEIRVLAGLPDPDRDPTEALDPAARLATPQAALARGSGPLQPVQVLVTPRPDWYPEAQGVEAARPHFADWNWDPALGDWVRHFYLRQRLEAGSWSLQLAIPGVVAPSVQPVQSDGRDGVITFDLHLPPPSGN